MRTISTAIERALASGNVSNWVKVEIKDAGGTWRDMGDLDGRDWVRSFRHTRGVDRHIASCTIDLHMREDGRNLSPLHVSSKLNTPNIIVSPWHEIRVSTATMPTQTLPTASDYAKIFQGRITKTVMSNADTLNLTCLDEGVVLAKTYVEAVTEYAANTPESIIQSILTQWGGGVTLYGAATGAVFTRYEVERSGVLDVVRKLSHMIGWDVRYMWWAGTADFELVMYEPDRSLSGYGGGATDRSYSQAQWGGISIDIPTDDVRNKIVAIYEDGANGGNREVRTTDDIAALASDITASQNKYGVRWCEFAMDATSRLDSTAEVDTFLTAAFYDMYEPVAAVRIDVPYLFAFELNDVIGLTADDIHFDSDQRLALYSVEDVVVNGGRGVSRLMLRGTPSVGTGTWLRKQIVYDETQAGARNIPFDTARYGNLCPNYNFAGSDW